MGNYTLTDFQDYLRLELGNRDDIESLLTRFINTAYMTLTTKNRFWGLQRDFYFPELERRSTDSTRVGVENLATPADCLIVRLLYDVTNDSYLEPISFTDYTKKTGRKTESSYGKPKKWVRRGTYIYLYPTPDNTYEMDISYRKRPALLSNPTDVTNIGAEWDEVILKLAVIQSLMRLKRYDEAKREKDDWLEMVSGIIGIYDQEKRARKDMFKPDHVYLDFS